MGLRIKGPPFVPSSESFTPPPTVDLAVLKMIFNFALGPGGPGGGSGLPFSSGNHRYWADSGPNPKIFNFYVGLKHS